MPAIQIRDGNANALLRFYKKVKADFELSCSNYSIEIKTTDGKDKFVKNLQSMKTFAAFQKIKKDVKGKPIPEIDREALRYFEHNFSKPVAIPVVYNIDLKSAYATILYNDGIISAETFDYISKLKKEERLAAVGMLASKKHLFTFKSGKPVDPFSTHEAETANFFFYAVQRTDEIMLDLKNLCENSYLFTWVDGIYFTDENRCEAIVKYCNRSGLRCTVDRLEKFTVKFFEKKVMVRFLKDGKLKEFTLPMKIIDFKKMMLETLQEYNGTKSIVQSKIRTNEYNNTNTHANGNA